MMSSAGGKRCWFPAKRYGWGWGLPSVWQGWVVLITYFTLVLGGIPFIQVPRGSVLYVASVLTVALIAVCWLKGEPPRWRWGGRGVSRRR